MPKKAKPAAPAHITIAVPREKLLKPSVVAADLDISLVTLTRMRRAGEITHVVLRAGGRKLIRYRANDIDALIEKLTVKEKEKRRR